MTTGGEMLRRVILVVAAAAVLPATMSATTPAAWAAGPPDVRVTVTVQGAVPAFRNVAPAARDTAATTPGAAPAASANGACPPTSPCETVGCGPGRICVYAPKQCFTTPCPQYECVSVIPLPMEPAPDPRPMEPAPGPRPVGAGSPPGVSAPVGAALPSTASPVTLVVSRDRPAG
ncbi:hypothetical protein ACQPYK_33370 [Streptosporangium sp. CA-135522]|uniref:hypothetical protein n=1 Tax=Streptosporangium sp. CA-135522 TaxID=3240072 RepID=UPI003D9472DE